MDKLSNEILEHVFSYLAPLEIDSCRLTCRRLRAVVEGSLLLRYLYSLQLSGRVDLDIHGSALSLSLSDRLSALQSLEYAWLKADFTPMPDVTLPVDVIAGTVNAHSAFYLLSRLNADHDIALGSAMRLSGTSFTRSSPEHWRKLDLTIKAQSESDGVRVARDIQVLEECNFVMIFSVYVSIPCCSSAVNYLIQ